MASPLAGAWELQSDTEVGLALFTDTHFSMSLSDRDRPAFASDDPTDAEAAEAFRTLQCAGGTYEIRGSTLVFHRLVNRHPNWTGRDYRWDYRLDGDRLTMGERNWRKVG